MLNPTTLNSASFDSASLNRATTTGLAFVAPPSNSRPFRQSTRQSARHPAIQQPHSVRLSPNAAITPTQIGSALPQRCSISLRTTSHLSSLSQTSSAQRSLIQLKCKQSDGVDEGIDEEVDNNIDNTDSENNLLQKLNIDVPPEVLDLYNQFKAFKNPIPGIQIGIPLNLFAQIFTQHHYGENIMGPGDIFLQCCIGYFTYGIDRLFDAQEAENSSEEISASKKAMYDAIKENRNSVMAAIAGSGIYTLQELSKSPETRPFIPLLASTLFYKQIKTHFGPVKPFYLSAMWALSSTVLPAVMHDHDWSILASPQDYLAPFLLLFGTTNFADIRDCEEDKANGVSTLPTAIGKEKTVLMSAAALALFALIMN